MTKEQYLAACAALYDELQALNKITDFYDYEVEFVKIWQGMGREVFEKNVSDLTADKRKKKPHDAGSYNDQQ
jgi:hypothetical protein